MNRLRVFTSCIVLLSSLCQADIYVVTHRDNPVEALAEHEVKDLYLARSRAFEHGETAKVYDRSNQALRERFVQSLLGMKVRQFDAYWARLVFAGRVLPLGKAEQDAELLQSISEDVHAIGYLEHAPSSADFKTLLVIAD